MLDGTIDFGATDTAMSDEELKRAKTPIVHFPTVVGAVVLAYNLPSLKQPLRLSSETVAEIFLGKIQKWSDPKILALNPGFQAPSENGGAIMVIHRTDGSGTTAVFTDYLAKISPQWKEKVGQGVSVNWPAGVGEKGNDAVTARIKGASAIGALGYVELEYAKSNRLSIAMLRNRGGAWVEPNNASIKDAVDSASKSLSSDFRGSITDPASKKAYPICSLTYLLLAKKKDPAKDLAVIEMLRWFYSEGQKKLDQWQTQPNPMTYVALPPALLSKAQERLKTFEASGK